MSLLSWSNKKPSTGKYTVAKVTQYSSGESETTVTTIHDPQVLKKRKIETEEFFDLPCLTQKQSDIALGFDVKEISDLDKELNKQRSLRRTKSVIRKKIIEGELDHFLTLTYRENKLDIKECWKDWKKFIRLVQKKYPTLKYLVIVERQKRGAVHFHAAIHGFLHANTIRSLWLSVVEDGNIDIKRRQRNQSLHGLAKYITKYLTKQYEDLDSFQNLYRCSKNIKLQVSTYYLKKQIQQSAFAEPEITNLIEYFLHTVNQHWEDRNGLYNCQWASSLSP